MTHPLVLFALAAARGLKEGKTIRLPTKETTCPECGCTTEATGPGGHYRCCPACGFDSSPDPDLVHPWGRWIVSDQMYVTLDDDLRTDREDDLDACIRALTYLKADGDPRVLGVQSRKDLATCVIASLIGYFHEPSGLAAPLTYPEAYDRAFDALATTTPEPTMVTTTAPPPPNPLTAREQQSLAALIREYQGQSRAVRSDAECVLNRLSEGYHLEASQGFEDTVLYICIRGPDFYAVRNALRCIFGWHLPARGAAPLRIEHSLVLDEVDKELARRNAKGYDALNDDALEMQNPGRLSEAAASLALVGQPRPFINGVLVWLETSPNWVRRIWGKHDRRQRLIIAIGLLVSEVELMDRATARSAE